ncbi:hypothetical protein K457DRAFT_1825532 [Linnemannia elongata AG-77]|uniref:PiggyBac transposable element-derived protein domain-containing protein n=1 Tax=Linnemannia elongata AG-77 TaxID=1314771 RepID=A0A197JD58_9FUNG|nr:hypothetical protein K457DRAFT_1825532 [Linnemannia elongata AG-77]
MNGVDLSDQYRSYYSTQLTVFRTWMPLFFWILDTTIVNSYRIYKAQGGTVPHKDFRIALAWALVSEGNASTHIPKIRHHHKQQEAHAHSHKLQYVTKSRNELSPPRFVNKGDHCPEKIDDGTRPNCILCRHKATVLGDETCDVKTPTTWICGCCKVPLCLTKARNCYKEYHGF